jgi:hypothetical protein
MSFVMKGVPSLQLLYAITVIGVVTDVSSLLMNCDHVIKIEVPCD